jgi:uncharacterized protein YcfJ
MKTIWINVLAIGGLLSAAQALSQVTFYEREGYGGRSFTSARHVDNLQRSGFRAGAASAVVDGDRWEVCDAQRFAGRCVVLRPGRYRSLDAMGMNAPIASMRGVARSVQVDDRRYAQVSPANSDDGYDYRRRSNERLYQARVTSVHAVVGPPEQRCWMEREQVAQESSRTNVPGAIAGALIGGILGHQIGGGRGKDLATVGGAVAGAAVGANAGRDRNGQQAYGRDVERCTTTQGPARTEYWDVAYQYRGQEHRVQMNAPPGRTVTVNRDGEPRA